MTEHEIRRVLVDVVPELPAPADRLAAVGRRVRRRRVRTAAGTTTAGVAAIAVLAGVFLTVDGGRMAPVQPPLASSAAPRVVVPSASRATTGHPSEPEIDATPRLRAAYAAAIRAAAPSVQFRGELVFQHTDTGGDAGYAMVRLVRAAGRQGTVWITIETPTGPQPNTCAEQAAPGAGCRDEVGPHGEKVVVLAATGDGSDHGRHDRATVVRVQRLDKSFVTVTADNATRIDSPSSETSFGIETSAYTGGLPPLTVEQVKAIALDPALTLYP
ncbi:hypothetical protein [Hamadaea tsunoensis]|uniref:hypothetical protein n=1 Tax=Hamadaea tsunoensis TaxID=53368 RepID=UPI0012F78990|nr:hypothetical protein [Hamadaea tsunoensis]